MNKIILLCLTTLFVLASFALADPTPAPGHCANNATADAKPPVGIYNSTCIAIQLAARLKVDGDHYILMKNGTFTGGVCEKNKQTITIKDECFELSFAFVYNETTQMKSLGEIDGMYFLNSGNGTFKLPTTILEFPNATNFRCNTEQSFNVTTKSNSIASTGLLFLSHLKIDAFNPRTNNLFNLTDDHVCNLDSSDWVQWAVFLCLVGLVIIVLVAYFVSRRRWSERSSYESV